MALFSVQTKKLLIVAGVVWLAAGVGIAAVGVQALLRGLGLSVLAVSLAACAVFLVFHAFVFSKMVAKHVGRIQGYSQERMCVARFFDAKSYVMMAVMMGSGIALRTLGVMPDWFVSFFYTGLGAALALAGANFLFCYANGSLAACPVSRRLRR